MRYCHMSHAVFSCQHHVLVRRQMTKGECLTTMARKKKGKKNKEFNKFIKNLHAVCEQGIQRSNPFCAVNTSSFIKENS